MKPTPLSLAAVAAVIVTAGRAMFFTPFDAAQGAAQKIMYLHGPATWVAYLAFGLVAVSSLLFLRHGEHRLDRIAESSAEVGVAFLTIALVTGGIWRESARNDSSPSDGSLSLTLALLVIYGGCMMLRALVKDRERRARLGAWPGIAGALLIAGVHGGRYLAAALDSGSGQLGPGATSLTGAMQVTRMLALGSFTLLFVALLRARYRFAVDRDGAHPPEPFLA